MSPRIPLSAAILCGGAGRRLGGTDKGQLILDGQSFIDRQLAVLRPLTPDLMLIDRTASHAATAGVRVVADAVHDGGALGGIYTALEAAAADRVIVIACDMPFLTTEFLRYLLSVAETADVVIPRDERGRHPVCGVFHRRIGPTLKTQLDQRRLRVEDALSHLDVHAVTATALAPFDTDGRLLLNVNTPDDYRRAVSRDHQGTASA